MPLDFDKNRRPEPSSDQDWVLEYITYSGEERLVVGSEREMTVLRVELRRDGITQFRLAKADRLDAKGQLPLLRHSIRPSYRKTPGDRSPESVARQYMDWAIDKGLDSVAVFPPTLNKAGKVNEQSPAYRAAKVARASGLKLRLVDPEDYA